MKKLSICLLLSFSLLSFLVEVYSCIVNVAIPAMLTSNAHILCTPTVFRHAGVLVSVLYYTLLYYGMILL